MYSLTTYTVLVFCSDSVKNFFKAIHKFINDWSLLILAPLLKVE